jgi:hypothetical protein
MSVDKNAEALRFLASGPRLARDVAEHVGWEPRTAGTRMAALERDHFVAREEYRDPGAPNSARSTWRWRLADRGIALVQATAAHQPAARRANEAPGPERLDEVPPADTVWREVPPGAVDADEWVGATLTVPDWAGVLYCARLGVPSTPAATTSRARELIESVESMVGIRWTGQGYVPDDDGV